MTTEEHNAEQVITRIFIDSEGNLVITDLWEELASAFEIEDEGYVF